MQLPPAFPPLSPLNKAAGRGGDVRRAPSHMPSPHQSLLLDVPRHQSSAATARQPNKGKRTTLRPSGRRPTANEYLSPDEGEEDQMAGLDAMTTSKLIEEDSSLADSWKTFTGKGEMQESEMHDEHRPGNGVLGLLVEYSKAHAGAKGPKMG